MTGVLDLTIGDPATGSGSERVDASLVEDNGTRTRLLIARSQLDALGPRARTPGTRVQVTGEPAMEQGVQVLRVTAITLLPR
jgi:hypothetical protein